MPVKERRRPHRTPISPGRLRDTDRRGGFAFLPNRFLHDGFLATLSHNERSLYLFLVLAGDRQGISFYHFDRICSELSLPTDDYINARNGLIRKDLIAFDGTRFQVLSLPSSPCHEPSGPLTCDGDFEAHDPATIRQCILSSLEED